ncbi:MAG: hypothetical protein HRU18_01605 [Pseudoalteromonas sp.]|uniref:hypothetical protein n=1 Tax=Pseudoalteromonas sp. TaxID=53249 RepID=UPI001D914C8A|nr:hypothetical protein [Pseudoalteromonas sp.]NRA76877.1 hypothetical protein [Pseudoalteromonas sp.]
MIFGKEGQYVCSINIEGIDEEFMEHDGLEMLKIVEEAGNVLPTFALSFKTYLEDVVAKLNDGTIIKVSMGPDLENLEDYELSVSKFTSQVLGNSHIEIACIGFASKINYITDQPMQITDEKSGIEVAIETAGKHFKVDSNIEKSKDKMNWIQYSITDKKFMNDLLLHCNVPNSFVASAITANGDFILRDVAKAVKSLGGLYDWKFTKDPDDNPKAISIEGNLEISSKSGFLNNWTGYKKIMNGIDVIAKDTTDISTEDANVLLALASELDKAKSISDRFSGTRMMSDNVHNKYWECYDRNLKGLASLSRLGIPVSFSNEFKSVKPLQIAMYSQPSTGNEDEASEYVTGLYIISNVTKTIQANMFNITCILNRDALNVVKNEGV